MRSDQVNEFTSDFWSLCGLWDEGKHSFTRLPAVSYSSLMHSIITIYPVYNKRENERKFYTNIIQCTGLWKEGHDFVFLTCIQKHYMFIWVQIIKTTLIEHFDDEFEPKKTIETYLYLKIFSQILFPIPSLDQIKQQKSSWI